MRSRAAGQLDLASSIGGKDPLSRKVLWLTRLNAFCLMTSLLFLSETRGFAGALVLAGASPFFAALEPDVDAGLPTSVCIARSVGGQARRREIGRYAFYSPSFCRLAEPAAALPFLS